MTPEQRDLASSPDVTQVVRALKRLAKQWPRGIYLFANAGYLEIILDGDQNDGCGLLLTRIDGIPCDGGDAGEWCTE